MKHTSLTRFSNDSAVDNSLNSLCVLAEHLPRRGGAGANVIKLLQL